MLDNKTILCKQFGALIIVVVAVVAEDGKGFLFANLFLVCLSSDIVHLNLKINFSSAGFDWIRESSIHRSNFNQSSKCKLLHKSVSGLELLSTQNPSSSNCIRKILEPVKFVKIVWHKTLEFAKPNGAKSVSR